MVIHKAHFQSNYIGTLCAYSKDGIEYQKVLITIEDIDPVDGALIYMIDYPSIKFSPSPHNFMS